MRIRLKESRQIMMACMIKWRQLCKPRGSQVITLIWSCRKYSICRIFSTDPPIPTVIRKESDFWFTKSKFKSVFWDPSFNPFIFASANFLCLVVQDRAGWMRSNPLFMWSFVLATNLMVCMHSTMHSYTIISSTENRPPTNTVDSL